MSVVEESIKTKEISNSKSAPILNRILDFLSSVRLGIVLLCILVFLSVLVLLAFWDSNRMFAAGLLAVLYLGSGAACALVARGRLRERPPLFSATVGELAKDLDHLDRT